MREINIDNLIGVSITNRDSEQVDPRLFKIVEAEFIQLKGIWSKAFFIFLLEKAQTDRLTFCGKKLHLEMRMYDTEIYNRYFQPYILDMKRAFSITRDFSDIKTHIINSLVEFGETEYIILNRLLYNTSKDIYTGMNKSLPLDMVKDIESIYDNF